MKRNKNKATAIIIPGLLGYKEEPQIAQLVDSLAKIDVESITFTPSSMVTNKDGILSEYSQKAIYEELLEIIKNNQIRNSNLILIGLSAGGPIAFKYASQNDIQAVIGIVTPYQTGAGDDLSKIKDEWKTTGYIEMSSSKLGEIKLPFSYYQAAKQFNILDYGDKISCPQLFISGELDINVPTEASKRAYEACIQPKEFHIIKGMQHKYKNNLDQVQRVNQIVLNFLAKVLENK